MLNNSPRAFPLAGRTYMAGHLIESERGTLQAWVRDHVRSPMAALADSKAVARMAAPIQQRLVEAALAREQYWPPACGTLAWWEAIDSHPDGGPKVVHVILSRHNDVDEDEAARIHRDASQAEINALYLHAFYARSHDPKSPAAPTTPTTTASPAGATSA